MDDIRSHDSLSNNALAFSHKMMEPATYVGMDGGTGLVTAPFRCDEGY